MWWFKPQTNTVGFILVFFKWLMYLLFINFILFFVEVSLRVFVLTYTFVFGRHLDEIRMTLLDGVYDIS